MKTELSNYGVKAVNAPSFWKEGYEGQGSVVAVIDSGCNIEHPELKGNLIGQVNFTEDDNGELNNVTDYSGHGTHVAGIIAASNKRKIIGVAPKAKLLILKVVDKSEASNYERLIKAIDFATKWRGPNGEMVDVMNLSLGGKKDNAELRATIDQAILKNISIVVSSGNYGDGSDVTDEILYPGSYEEVFQISAVDIYNKPTDYNNTNSTIDFLAPGKEIYSTDLENSFVLMSGTSMAAPHVSGAIALLLNAFRSKNMKTDQQYINQYLICHSLVLEGYSIKTQGQGVLKL